MFKKSSEKEISLLAEFSGPADLLHAAEKVRDSKQFKNFDCHSPFPIHGMDAAMGECRSPLGWICGFVGFSGVIFMIGFTWWVSIIGYPIVTSGKPLFSYQAYLPPVFAIGVLSGAMTSAIGMIILNGLPRLNHILFNSDRFARATDDGFFISIASDGSTLDPKKAKSFLESIGGKNVEIITEE